MLRSSGLGGVFHVAREVLEERQCVEAPENGEAFKLIERGARNPLAWNSQEGRLVAPPDAVARDGSLLSRLDGDARIILFGLALRSFRIYNDLVTHRKAPVREPVVAGCETALAPDGSNLTRVLHTVYSGFRESKNSIDAGMRAAFGDDFEELIFGPADDQRVRLGVRYGKVLKNRFLPPIFPMGRYAS